VSYSNINRAARRPGFAGPNESLIQMRTTVAPSQEGGSAGETWVSPALKIVSLAPEVL